MKSRIYISIDTRRDLKYDDGAGQDSPLAARGAIARLPSGGTGVRAVASARRRRLPALAVLLAALPAMLASGCAEQAQRTTPTTVVIGILADQNSPAGGTGGDAVRAAQLAVEVVNGDFPELLVPLAAGEGLPGLGGATLTLATDDTHGDSQLVSDAATSLVGTAHAVVLLVAASADVAAAAGSEAQRLAVPLIDATSTADYLTELGLDWYFRVGPSDRMLAETAFAVMRRQLGGPAQVALLNGADMANASVGAMVSELAARSDDTLMEGQAIDNGHCDVVLAVADTAAEATRAIRADGGVSSRRHPSLGLAPDLKVLTVQAASWN